MDWTIFTELIIAIKWPVALLVIIFIILKQKK
jgi:hypothetical protein